MTQLEFQKVVDGFILKLGNEEKQRLVALYGLPPKYYDECSVIVFEGLKMTGAYSFENPEGLLDIAEVLHRKDLLESTRPQIMHLKQQKKLRKVSSVVDLNLLFDAVDIGPALEIAIKQIEVANASSELLQRICKYRFRNDRNTCQNMDTHLKNAIIKLREAKDLLTLAGEEAVDNLDPALPIPGRVPFATSTTLAIPETTDTVNQREPTYVNVGARSHILPTASPLQSSKAKTRQVENKPIKILEPSQQHTIRILNVTDSPPVQRKKPPPPKPPPKPPKNVNVDLDLEGYALPSSVFQPVDTENKEHTGSGSDSGYGKTSDWPVPQLKQRTYQKLLTQDLQDSVYTPPTPSPPPPKQKHHYYK